MFLFLRGHIPDRFDQQVCVYLGMWINFMCHVGECYMWKGNQSWNLDLPAYSIGRLEQLPLDRPGCVSEFPYVS